MDIVSRLKQYLDLHQVSVTQFADACGIPRPSVSQLLNGRNKKVSDEVISKIHTAYPDLSMLWLMFGEGNMESVANIEISEAQNQKNSAVSQPKAPVNQQNQQRIDFTSGNPQEKSEIFFERESTGYPHSEREEFTFEPAPASNPFPWTASDPQPNSKTAHGDQNSHGQQPAKPSVQHESAPQPVSQKQSITFNPEKGKRVVSIIVYYDDNSFEPFVPDTSGRNPFVR
jgi:Predicted transcriptional regulators